MNIQFFYYCAEFIVGQPFYHSYFHQDYSSYEKINPMFYQAIDELYKDLIAIEALSVSIQERNKVSIKFHSQYSIQDGIMDGKKSIERKKDKNQTLDNRLSFSISTTKGVSLFPINNLKDDFIYIPNDYKKTPVRIIFPEDLDSRKEERVIKSKKLKFKEFFSLIELLQLFNKKTLIQKKRQIPFLICT